MTRSPPPPPAQGHPRRPQGRPGASACAKAFAAQAAADAAPDELPELTAAELAAEPRRLLALRRAPPRPRPDDPHRAGARRQGRPGLDRLEIVQDDAPFLVDSVMGEIAEQGLSVRAMFHPIVEVQRDRAGVRGATGAAAPRVDDPGDPRPDRRRPRGRPWSRGVTETLADVRAAVDDFPAMLALMGQHARRAAGRTASRRGQRGHRLPALAGGRAVRLPGRPRLRISAH